MGKERSKVTALFSLALAALLAFAFTLSAEPPAKAKGAVFYAKGPEGKALELLESGTAKKIMGMGWSVSGSADGNDVLMSNPFTLTAMSGMEGKITTMGSVGLYDYRGEKAVLAATFTGQEPQALTTLFGAGSAISADGSVIFLGCPGATEADESRVYGFLKTTSGWTPERPFLTFTADDKKGVKFGLKIAMSGSSGQTVVIGSPGANGTGEAYLLIQPAGGWAAMTKKMNPKPLPGFDLKKGDEFGKSVAVSRDDSRIFIGAPGWNKDKGCVFAFEKSKTGWIGKVKVTVLSPNTAKEGDRYGESVACSKDGSTLIVGAPGADNGAGKIYLSYKYLGQDLGTAFSWAERLNFGLTVDASLNGRTFAVGTFGKNYEGSVVVFRSWQGSWMDKQEYGSMELDLKKASPEETLNAMYGFSLDVLDDGSAVVIGTPGYAGGEGTMRFLNLPK